jgi:hypothetical protein
MQALWNETACAVARVFTSLGTCHVLFLQVCGTMAAQSHSFACHSTAPAPQATALLATATAPQPTLTAVPPHATRLLYAAQTQLVT